MRRCDSRECPGVFRSFVVTDPDEVELAVELVHRRLNDAEWRAQNPDRVVVALDA